MMKTKSYIWITILCALCILVSCTAPTTETESIPGESSSLDSHSSQVSMESILETLSEEQSTSAEESTVSQATGETSTEESQPESEISDNTSEDESQPEISDDPSEDASQPEEDEKDEIKIYPELQDDPNHKCASSHWRYDETTHWDQCLCGLDLYEERHLFGLWEDGTDNTVQRTCRTCSYTQNFQKADTPKLEYIVNSDGKTCTITGLGTWYDTCLVIPSSIDGYTVTAIGHKAFLYETSYSSVRLSSTVKSIGDYSFCRGDFNTLVDWYIEDLSALCRIHYRDTSASCWVYMNHFYLNGEIITDLVIPDDVTEIKPYTFYSSNFNSITFSDSVTYIGERAFGNCRELKEINLPENCTIAPYAFQNSYAETLMFAKGIVLEKHGFDQLRGVKRLIVEEGVSTILLERFKNFNDLEEIILPSSLRKIEYWAFYGCDSLKSVKIPEGVKELDLEAFAACPNLVEMYFPSTLTTIRNTFHGTPIKKIYYNGTLEQLFQATENILTKKSFEGIEIICTNSDENS